MDRLATVTTLRPIRGRLWIIHPSDEARRLAADLAALDTDKETDR